MDFCAGDRVESKARKAQGKCQSDEFDPGGNLPVVANQIRVLWDDGSEYNVPVPALRRLEKKEREPRPENFPDYLRRVGGDYKESGSEATAEDYEEAAGRIQKAANELARICTDGYVRDPNIKSALRAIQHGLTVR